jgi:hypothetical protein
VDNRTVFKASIPAKTEKIIKSTGPLPVGTEASADEKAREKTELERGYS